MYINVCVYTHMYLFLSLSIYIYIYMYRYLFLHVHVHVYIYIYLYIYMCPSSLIHKEVSIHGPGLLHHAIRQRRILRLSRTKFCFFKRLTVETCSGPSEQRELTIPCTYLSVHIDSCRACEFHVCLYRCVCGCLSPRVCSAVTVRSQCGHSAVTVRSQCGLQCGLSFCKHFS